MAKNISHNGFKLNDIAVPVSTPRVADFISSFTKQTQLAIQIQTMLLGVVKTLYSKKGRIRVSRSEVSSSVAYWVSFSQTERLTTFKGVLTLFPSKIVKTSNSQSSFSSGIR